MSAPVYAALVHYPVRNRAGETFTTAVTPLDVHDIARSAQTFGVRGYFLVTPVAPQQALLARILGHWSSGGVGERRMPERSTALQLCSVTDSLEQAVAAIEAREGGAPLQVATAARASAAKLTSTAQLRERVASSAQPVLLVFGTGHGLTESYLEAADLVLEPICGSGAYNHLSVRAAVAIYLDRILGSHRTPLEPVRES